MRRPFVTAMLALLVVAAAAGHARGAFEPLFRTMKPEGDCTVAAPGAPQFSPAVDGKAYPYGTRLKTGKKASCTINFADQNEASVGPMALMTVGESQKDKKVKVLTLERGKLDLALADGFEQQNGMRVETHCTSIVALQGGRYGVDALSEADLNGVLVATSAGKLRVVGPNFEIPALERDEWVNVSCAIDNSKTLIEIRKGTVDMTLRDEDGNPKTVSLEPDSKVRIWRQRAASNDALIVTVLIISPEGKLIESITSRVPITEITSTSAFQATRWIDDLSRSTPTTTPASGYGYVPKPRPEPPTPTPVGRGREDAI